MFSSGGPGRIENLSLTKIYIVVSIGDLSYEFLKRSYCESLESQDPSCGGVRRVQFPPRALLIINRH